MDNFLQTENPFQLATPPAWFLSALKAYDPLLVLFPSRVDPVYRSGRRTTRRKAALNKVLQHYPDSAIFVAHKLWPWKSIEPQVAQLGNSWQKLLGEIPEYDQWAVGSADAAADRLDALDAQADAAVDREIQGELDARSHDGYILAKAAMGQRVGLSARKPEGARTRRPGRPAYRPLNFGGGSAIFIGR